ncbi:MAG: putative DNA binding domain-containing protein [Treponema sp.]|jgi:ATP-dependent DNA helicase RecG|nr:putative DNA binding domain-containing protein [Treponema sp.]
MQRYSDEELTSLLSDLESDLVERKESFSGETPKRARETVCAFANDLPGHNRSGVLFIGVKDDGTPSGLKVTDHLLLTLSDMETDGNIRPFPVITVEKRNLKGAAIAVVTVLPSDSTPVKYDGRIWIRIGPRRAIANEQEERILIEKRQSKQVPFDLRPVFRAVIDDLSRVFFEEEYLPKAVSPEILTANNRTYEEKLAACRMIVSPDDTTPTFTGMLALGKNPQDFIYGAYIQFLRIDGDEYTDPITDEQEIKGRLSEMLKTAEMKLAAYNKKAFDIVSGPAHVISWDYPETALRQILYNAILRRSYESNNAPVHMYIFNDRIEFLSPGGPYGAVSADNFGAAGLVSYRNKNIADVLKTIGVIQRFGLGLRLARDAMAANGNPPIEFEVDSGFVRCVLKKRQTKKTQPPAA